MQVAFTGSRGFLGAAVAKAIGARALHLDGDVREPATFGPAAGASALVHFAALSSVPQSQQDPRTTWDVNVNGTLALLDWARAARFKGRVVVVSSAHVYGAPNVSTIPESTPLSPRSPYGASKAASEALAMAYRVSYGLDIVTVRPFNVYGPGQAAGFLVADMFSQLAKGPTMTLGDPKPVRDFVYLDDATDFFQALLAASTDLPPVLNLGSGHGTNIRDMAKAAVAATGKPANMIFQEGRRRVGETNALVADINLAKKVLAWNPRISLEEGLRRTWQAWPR